MKSLVVFFALAAVACGSIIPYAQPAHHAALVLDPHGRPLDTAEVINARAIHLQAKALEGHGALLHGAIGPIAHSVIAAPAVVAAPAVFAAPAAVSHQSRVDVRTSPAIVTAHAAPVLAAHGAYAAPLLGHSAFGVAGHGHLLKKRSLGHFAYAAPVIAHAAPIIAHAAPVFAHAAPAAVSHQSRVDVRTSPAIVSHAIAAPVVAHAAAAPVFGHAIAPAAVSHQSRVDVRTSPAVISHAAIAPIGHGLVSAPLAHGVLAAPLAHSGLLHSAPLAHAW